MARLAVFLGIDLVGFLEQRGKDTVRFAYAPEWLERSECIPLSRSLPLQETLFSAKKTRPFFAGILPEEGPRKQVAAILGISETNDFAMLEEIGGECAGALTLLPEGDSVLSHPDGGGFRKLSQDELEDIVRELPRRPLMAGKAGVRLSLAGAQDKLPVVVDRGQFILPLGNSPSTHILKPEPDRFPGLATNEVFCMTLARMCSIGVPSVQYCQVGEKPCVLVERYDRERLSPDLVKRIHQEDFCQALGLPPERKYQSEGGPGLENCFALLREWSSAPVLDIRDFLDGVVFNVIIGNADAHGKNYSMLYTGQEKRLAPFYDLVCTLAWDELSKTLAMNIGNCKQINALTQAHWQHMAKRSGLGWPMVRERIRRLSETVAQTVPRTVAAFQAVEQDHLVRVAEIVCVRAKKISAMVS